jgi:hypothetical protein
VRYLRERFPEQAHTRRSEELTRFVVAARDRAKAHGILEEPDVATALDLTVMYGADFYSATWVRDVFAMTEWSGSKKLDVIRARVRRQIHDF